MMEICMRKYAINASTHRSQLSNWRLFDWYPVNELQFIHWNERSAWQNDMWHSQPAWKIFATVKQTRRTVQCMARVINGWTLFRCFMRGTQEYPLFGGCHLCACTWHAMRLKPNGQSIQFHAKLPARRADYVIGECLHAQRKKSETLSYLKCSYFHTPSSCPSGMVRINSIFDGSFLINCCMYCCTAKVLSISSNDSSGQRQKSYKYINYRKNKFIQRRNAKWNFSSIN